MPRSKMKHLITEAVSFRLEEN